MNILFLMKVFEVGGQEVVTNTLAQCFWEHGHNVTIASFKKPSKLMAARVNNNIPLYTLGEFKYTKENVDRLREILNNRDIDIVINQWGLPYVPAKILKSAKILNEKEYHKSFKTIAVYHNSPDTNARIKDVEIALNETSNFIKKTSLTIKKIIFKQVTSLSMRYVYKVSDIYQVLSPSFVKSFQTFTKVKDLSKLMVQTNPVTIDSSDFVFDSKQKQKEIIYVGRIDYNQKRVYRIIDTWSVLEKRFPDWKLTIIGDGEAKKDVEQQVHSLNLKHVYFEGFQQPKAYYKRASVLMLTSEYEGFPLVLAECMSFGVVPAVYGSYSAVYDIIKDSINGLILPYNKKGFDSSLMADKLTDLMGQPEVYEKMALEAIVTSKNYSLNTIYESWNSLFLKLNEKKS